MRKIDIHFTVNVSAEERSYCDYYRSPFYLHQTILLLDQNIRDHHPKQNKRGLFFIVFSYFIDEFLNSR